MYISSIENVQLFCDFQKSASYSPLDHKFPEAETMSEFFAPLLFLQQPAKC